MNDPPRKRRTSVFAESENLGEAGLCLADQNKIAGSPPRRARWGLICAVSKRVPRVYLEDGRIVERSLRLL